jgi:hypothetical protein
MRLNFVTLYSPIGWELSDGRGTTSLLRQNGKATLVARNPEVAPILPSCGANPQPKQNSHAIGVIEIARIRGRLRRLVRRQLAVNRLKSA